MEVVKLDDNYFNFNIQTLAVFGMWNRCSGKNRNYILYNYYAIGLFCLAGVPQTTAEMMHAWNNRNNIATLTQHLTIVIGMVSTMIKVVNLLRRRDDVEELIDLLNYERRQPCNRKFAIYREKIVTSTIRACRLLSLTFIVMVFWYAIVVYGRILVLYKGNMEMLPLSPIVRLLSNKTSYYWLLFAYDELTFSYIAGAVASHDSLFMVCLIHLATQLDLVKRRLISCHDNLENGHKEEFIESVTDTKDFKIECVCRSLDTELSINPVTELKMCIKHHQYILRYVKLIHSIFDYTLLLQFASSLVMITMTGFQVVTGSQLSSSEFLQHSSILLCALFQLFLYCWFGTDIIAKSESLNSAAYHSQWYVGDERFKSTLRILMCKGQVPIKIKVGRVVEVSSATFMTIVSKCYSAMALLQRVDE